MSSLTSGVAGALMQFAQKEFGLRSFIETGTFMGESTKAAALIFDYVLTIEIDAEQQKQAIRNGLFDREDDVDIESWVGDSAELMPGAVNQVEGRAFFWLDGHGVAGQFGDHDYCPLIPELEAIVQDEIKHVILIDDAHCFFPPLPLHLTPEAWPTYIQVQEVLVAAGYEVRVAHDLIIAASAKDMQKIEKFLNEYGESHNFMSRRLSCVGSAYNGPLQVGAVPAVLPAFTGLLYTKYGWMLTHRLDPNQTAALKHTGVSLNHADIEKLAEHLPQFGAVFVDVGANIGCYSFGLRRKCATVHSFEPQRIIFNMMAGSVALNGWQNIFCYNVALGNTVGNIEVPQFDYNKPLSFGSIEFGHSEQRERLTQTRQHNDAKQETIPITTLDSYHFPRVDLLKIDVEGMELDVLAGAALTISRCRPIIFIEHGKSNRQLLAAVIEAQEYVVQEWGTMDYLCLPV